MIYESALGSTVTAIPGKGVVVDLDWFEEGVCIEADFWFEPGPPPVIEAACGCAECLDVQQDVGEHWSIELTPKGNTPMTDSTGTRCDVLDEIEKGLATMQKSGPCQTCDGTGEVNIRDDSPVIGAYESDPCPECSSRRHRAAEAFRAAAPDRVARLVAIVRAGDALVEAAEHLFGEDAVHDDVGAVLGLITAYLEARTRLSSS